MDLFNTTETNHSEEETLFHASAKAVTSSTVSKVFKIMPLTFVMLASVAGNSIVIHAVYADIRMRTATNVLIVSQSVVDLGTSVLVIPFALVSVGCDGWIFGVEFCAANGFFNLYFTQITVLQLVIIAFDRYLVIVKPSYHAINLKDAIKLTSVAWIVSFLGSFPWLPLLTNHVRVEYFHGFYVCAKRYSHPVLGAQLFSVIFVITVFAVLPLFFIFYSYYHINRVIHLNKHRVSPVSLSNAQKMAINVYAKSASTSKTVIGTSLLQVFPACFMMLLDGLQVGRFPDDVKTAAKWIMWCHCAVKPIIYATKSRMWAKTIRKYLLLFPLVSALSRMDLEMAPLSKVADRVKNYRLSRRIHSVEGNENDTTGTLQQTSQERTKKSTWFNDMKNAWQVDEQNDFCEFWNTRIYDTLVSTATGSTATGSDWSGDSFSTENLSNLVFSRRLLGIVITRLLGTEKLQEHDMASVFYYFLSLLSYV